METATLKKKLKSDFEKILNDEKNLETLNKVFTKIITEEQSSTKNDPQKHAKEENANQSNKSSSDANLEVRSWEDFKKKMKAKYGF